MFRQVLIANRGLIQANCVRAVKELGAKAITIYEEEDKESAGVRNADEAYEVKLRLPNLRPYLDMTQIVDLATRLGVDAVHPGYGFLAQNTRFAEELRARGITLIAPRVSGIQSLADKHIVKAFAARLGLPILPCSESFEEREWLHRFAEAIGYPLMIKAAHGYGGIGLRTVWRREELDRSFDAVQVLCRKFLLDTTEVFLEKFFPNARHIEFPLLCDQQGGVAVFPPQECSVQRRFQKLMVETPATCLAPELRARLEVECHQLARQLGVMGFASVEFLVIDGRPYFLEINGYIQPSHTAATLLTGVDLLKEQISIYAGQPLELRPEQLQGRGHVLGAFIFAEDPENEFTPSPGRVDRLYLPFGEEVYVQSTVFSGANVSPFYDPMVATLTVRGLHRREANTRLTIALQEFFVEGVKTNIPFLRAIASSPEFMAGHIDTQFLADPAVRSRLLATLRNPAEEEIAAMVAALALQREPSSPAPAGPTREGPPPFHGAAARWVNKRKRPLP